MAIPLVFIGIAAITGTIGVGKGVKAGVDHSHAGNITDDANGRITFQTERLDLLRNQCGEALVDLGEEKVFVLNNSVKRFLDSFEQIKNVDFQESVGLDELDKMRIDTKEFGELKRMSNFAVDLTTGSMAGAAGGALTAFGAYSAASWLATASTGTAISTLSGAAASNATLAFFGGGSLAAGGMGVAGGSAVLGGLVAGPALLVMGIIVGAKAGKELEDAKAYAAEADELCEEYENGAIQCIAIRRRTYMFYNLLARMDAYLIPLIQKMEDVITNEGLDYSQYSIESKKVIAAAASAAVTVKTILDTPILSEEGNPTEESRAVAERLMEK